MAERRPREAEDAGDKTDERKPTEPPATTPRSAVKANGANGKDDVHHTPDEVPVPSIPPAPEAGPWRSYKEVVAQLAGRIVEAQRPIRVLQALRWDDAVEEVFLKAKQRELPRVDVGTYQSVDLGFD